MGSLNCISLSRNLISTSDIQAESFDKILKDGVLLSFMYGIISFNKLSKFYIRSDDNFNNFETIFAVKN